MLCCLRLQHCVDLCLGGLLLFLAGLQQVEAAGAAAEMATLNWKPFIYGGMASIVAEFGRLRAAPQHANPCCPVCAAVWCYTNFDAWRENIKECIVRFWLMMRLAQPSSLMHIYTDGLSK